MQKQLKADILDRVKTDPDLFAQVSKALDVTPPSTVSTINRGSRRLTEYAVLEAISNYTGIEIAELTEDVEEIEKVA